MRGFFQLSLGDGRQVKINFKGIAFGGLYGGHNVSIEISKLSKKKLDELHFDASKIEELLTEVQKRIMQGDMVVEFDKIKPEATDGLGNVTA